jgi:hypothetical protein
MTGNSRLRGSIGFRRHARPGAGHDVLCIPSNKDVDGRDNPGHDGMTELPNTFRRVRFRLYSAAASHAAAAHVAQQQ